MNLLESYINISKTNNIKINDINNINPKQFVNCIDSIPIICYEVNYLYTTVRGNKKNGNKYFLFNSFNPQINMKEKLDKYIEDFNKEHPNRKLLNVKFLNSKCLGYMTL